ncbi:hypothetical protein SPV2_gp26 [Sulfolobus polyhedral virus 2]|uniref:Uncharacterized protein n=1 Tax=Sulfolobus polyhedral virus 2 TaxID=2493125 RepID=A0A3Q8Q449_9VIRU|nr:hypothetical protein KM458_gp26 [Sulfolobus polyhedral virus 2]AZI76025.1 hypothetical protein SPV2_gp26 [Sulfolobus polyhedral virus 2]
MLSLDNYSYVHNITTQTNIDLSSQQTIHLASINGKGYIIFLRFFCEGSSACFTNVKFSVKANGLVLYSFRYIQLLELGQAIATAIPSSSQGFSTLLSNYNVLISSPISTLPQLTLYDAYDNRYGAMLQPAFPLPFTNTLSFDVDILPVSQSSYDPIPYSLNDNQISTNAPTGKGNISIEYLLYNCLV